MGRPLGCTDFFSAVGGEWWGAVKGGSGSLVSGSGVRTDGAVETAFWTHGQQLKQCYCSRLRLCTGRATNPCAATREACSPQWRPGAAKSWKKERKRNTIDFFLMQKKKKQSLMRWDVHHGPYSVPSRMDPSSPTRDQTHIPWIARQILNHWTTREVPGSAPWHTSSPLVLVAALISGVMRARSFQWDSETMSLARACIAGEWQGQDLSSGLCFLRALCDRAALPSIYLEIT